MSPWCLAQSIITIVVALLLGVKFSSGFPGILLILVTVSFFELALSGIFLFVGMRSRKTETISAIGSAVFFPIIFISSAMFPVSFFPSWAQTISEYNPVSYAADVTRQLVLGGLSWSTVVSAYSVIGFIAIVSFAATLYQFRKVISESLNKTRVSTAQVTYSSYQGHNIVASKLVFFIPPSRFSNIRICALTFSMISRPAILTNHIR